MDDLNEFGDDPLSRTAARSSSDTAAVSGDIDVEGVALVSCEGALSDLNWSPGERRSVERVALRRALSVCTIATVSASVAISARSASARSARRVGGYRSS
jgi:hypothetical protein